MSGNETHAAGTQAAIQPGVAAQQPESAPADPPTPSASALIIGQATAVLAVAAAVVYAAGGLSLGLKLWYDQYSWEPVLGSLPRNFLLVDALMVMPFALIIGFVTYHLYEMADHRPRSSIGRLLLSVALAAALSAVPLVFLHYVRKTTIPGVIRPYWEIFVVCFLLNLVFVGLAFYVLPRINTKGLQKVLSIGVFAFAFIPAIASVSAAFRFPIVKLCGPAFRDKGDYGHYAVGNLIGTSGQWVYVAETLATEAKRNQYIFHGSYIAVIPLSAVQLESIGADATCGDLRTGGVPGG